LPNTGEANTVWEVVIGSVILVATFGLVSWKRRKI